VYYDKKAKEYEQALERKGYVQERIKLYQKLQQLEEQAGEAQRQNIEKSERQRLEAELQKARAQLERLRQQQLQSQEREVESEKDETSQAVDDSAWIRRVYLDLTGLVPPADKVEAFLKDQDPAKRSKLIDALLGEADEAATTPRLEIRQRKSQADAELREAATLLEKLQENLRLQWQAESQAVDESQPVEPSTDPAAQPERDTFRLRLKDVELKGDPLGRNVVPIDVGKALDFIRIRDVETVPLTVTPIVVGPQDTVGHVGEIEVKPQPRSSDLTVELKAVSDKALTVETAGNVWRLVNGDVPVESIHMSREGGKLRMVVEGKSAPHGRISITIEPTGARGEQGSSNPPDSDEEVQQPMSNLLGTPLSDIQAFMLLEKLRDNPKTAGSNDASDPAAALDAREVLPQPMSRAKEDPTAGTDYRLEASQVLLRDYVDQRLKGTVADELVKEIILPTGGTPAPETPVDE
jgi:hypothetical protein